MIGRGVAEIKPPVALGKRRDLGYFLAGPNVPILEQLIRWEGIESRS